MPDWCEEAIVLSASRFGEDASRVTLLTESHGRHAGLVRGGQSKRLRPVLQAGNKVMARWRARLYDHLGDMRVELVTAHAAHCLTHPLKLASVAAMSSLIPLALAEREPMPRVYAATTTYLAHLTTEPDPLLWLSAYIRWEVGILAAAGFGLALDACAVTGETENLVYVSPRTGAAVTEAAAGKHIAKLLPLPSFLGGMQTSRSLAGEVLDGMRLTTHFIDREIFAGRKPSLASPRQRLHAMIETRYSDGASDATETQHATQTDAKHNPKQNISASV